MSETPIHKSKVQYIEAIMVYCSGERPLPRRVAPDPEASALLEKFRLQQKRLRQKRKVSSTSTEPDTP